MRLICSASLLVSISLAGCGMKRSALVGTYGYSYTFLYESLTLNEDSTFQYQSGSCINLERGYGRWKKEGIYLVLNSIMEGRDTADFHLLAEKNSGCSDSIYVHVL